MLDCLLFDLKAFMELMAYVRGLNTEICGIGRIQRDVDDIPHVTEIKILPQIAGATDANVTAADMGEFFDTMIQDPFDLSEDTSETAEWCFNWHSHVRMKTNPSGTDLTNYDNLNDLFEVLVPFIFNQDGEYNGYVYHSHPVRHSAPVPRIWIYEWKDYYDKLGHVFDNTNQVKFIEAMASMQGVKLDIETALKVENEIKDKVKPKTYPRPVVHPPTSYGYYSGAYNQDYLEDSIDSEWRKRQADIAEDEEAFFRTKEAKQTSKEMQTKGSLIIVPGGTPHNWPLPKIVEEMADYDFDWDERTRTFHGRHDGANVIWSIRDAKDFLTTVEYIA